MGSDVREIRVHDDRPQPRQIALKDGVEQTLLRWEEMIEASGQDPGLSCDFSEGRLFIASVGKQSASRLDDVTALVGDVVIANLGHPGVFSWSANQLLQAGPTHAPL
jgi:hypothetical protein